MVLIETDVNGVPVDAVKAGVTPIYFDDATRPSPDTNYPELIYISRQCWTYLGYAGLTTPWHDQDEPFKLLRIQRDKFRKFFFDVAQMDIAWKTYCFLLYISSTYDKWERPTLLTLQNPAKSWFKKLRKHAGSSEMVDHVGEFVKLFVELQIENSGKATFSPSTWLEADPTSILEVQRLNKSRAKKVASGQKVREQKFVKRPAKYYSLFHRIVDRINFLNSHGLNYKDWVRLKFSKCVQFRSMSHVPLQMIVNVNSFDPDIKAARTRFDDPWRDVKSFLGLSLDCTFPDNCIPKGWRPASEDMADIRDIACVKADGYYYYVDGSQRRGKRHYATNKYLVISCIPSNFEEFKATWDDVRRLSGRPTWEEYSKWGLYPDVWTEEGISRHSGVSNITWRR